MGKVLEEWRHIIHYESDSLRELAVNSNTLQFFPTIAWSILNISVKLRRLASKCTQCFAPSTNDMLCDIFRREAKTLSMFAQQKSGLEESYIEDEMAALLYLLSKRFKQSFNHSNITTLSNSKTYQELKIIEPFREILEDKYYFMKNLKKQCDENKSKHAHVLAFFLSKYSKVIRKQISHIGWKVNSSLIDKRKVVLELSASVSSTYESRTFVSTINRIRSQIDPEWNIESSVADDDNFASDLSALVSPICKPSPLLNATEILSSQIDPEWSTESSISNEKKILSVLSASAVLTSKSSASLNKINMPVISSQIDLEWKGESSSTDKDKIAQELNTSFMCKSRYSSHFDIAWNKESSLTDEDKAVSESSTSSTYEPNGSLNITNRCNSHIDHEWGKESPLTDKGNYISEFRNSTSSTCKTSESLNASASKNSYDGMSFNRGSSLFERLSVINYSMLENPGTCFICCLDSMYEERPVVCTCPETFEYVRPTKYTLQS